MTSDELLNELEGADEWACWFTQPSDKMAKSSDAPFRAAARIRELEAQNATLKRTVEYCGSCVEWWQRIVDDKTHVIVPVTLEARIREQRELLDECETLIVAMRQEIQNLGGSLEGVITADATLDKLRAPQEKADG